MGAQSPATTGSIDTCGAISNNLFGSNVFVGANIDPGLLSGWGVRPSDWSYSVSVQQQIFPKAAVEVGYYRRSFFQFTTTSVNDNLAVGPADLTPFFLTAPTDSRLPGGGGYKIGPLYNLTPAAFVRTLCMVRGESFVPPPAFAATTIRQAPYSRSRIS